jgi:predicted nucleic acid-binding protein
MFVLDTNVVSELRRAKGGRSHPRVTAWATSVADTDMFVSAYTIFELENGILRLERRDAVQGAILRRWFEDVVLLVFAGRILPADVDVARCCAALNVPKTRPERDGWIAATALVHGMIVVTRNVADFQPMGVASLNPWEY